MNKQIIFSRTLAKMLIRSGFKMTNMSINRSNPENSMYWFDDKEGLTEIIENYTISQRLKNNEYPQAI